jgi:hypothetical protein
VRQVVHCRDTSCSDYQPSAARELSRAPGFLDASPHREIRRPTGYNLGACGSDEYRNGNTKHGGKSVE